MWILIHPVVKINKTFVYISEVHYRIYSGIRLISKADEHHIILKLEIIEN